MAHKPSFGHGAHLKFSRFVQFITACCLTSMAELAIAQESNATAADLMSRVYAQNDLIQTFEARFHTKFEKFARVHQQHEWESHYYYQAPDRYRIDFWPTSKPELLESEATLGGDSPLRILRNAPDRPQSGSIVANNRRGSDSGPSVSRYFLHLTLQACRAENLTAADWNVRSAKGNICIFGKSLNSATTSTLELDPSKEFAIVAWTNESELARRKFLVNKTYEYVKTQEGFWIPAFATSTQMEKGEKGLEYDYQIDINSVRVNQPIDRSVFALDFPTGTRVVDSLTKQSYSVGGDSRSSDDLEQMLSKAELMAGTLPDAIQPHPGALQARRRNWFNVAVYLTLAVSAAVVLISGLRFLRRAGGTR